MADQGIRVFPQPTAPPQVRNTFFRGPNGIRAGWRVLIFLAILAGLIAAINLVVFLVMRLLGRSGQPFGIGSLTPTAAVLSDGAILLFTSLAGLVMARIERRKWGQYGLPAASAFGRNFWVGLVSGFTAISVALLAIFLFHGFHLAGLAIHGKTILAATAAWTAAFVIVGLGEEFAFRGYLQFTLTTGMGFWPSAILLSALFALAHAANPGESKFGLFSVACFGLLFCFILRRTGNLWWVVGFHAGWDWGQTFFYGVSDSGMAPYHNLFSSTFHGPSWITGGSVGPEASVFTPLVLLLVGILFSRLYRENRYIAGR
jgi:membrane protease YdiL (CAAX protease family)